MYFIADVEHLTLDQQQGDINTYSKMNQNF